MANAHQIIKAIGAIVTASRRDYYYWHVGITNHPEETKESCGNAVLWHQWKADSSKDAQDVELFFVHEKGMKCATAGDITLGTITYVYIF